MNGLLPTKRKFSACLQCNKSHVHCDGERPCNRCFTRGINCSEPEKKKRGPKFKSERRESVENPSTISFVSQQVVSNAFDMGYVENQYQYSVFNSIQQYQNINQQQLPTYSQENSFSSTVNSINNHNHNHNNDNREGILPYVRYEEHLGIMQQLIKWGFKVHVEELTKVVEEYKKVVQFLNEEQITQLSLDYEKLLKDVTYASDQLEFPIITFVEFGVGIHHVNQALRDFTGWTGTVPSPAKNGAFMGLFDLKTLHKFNDLFPKIMVSSSKKKASLDGSMITPNGNFEEGRILITVKRDIFGLPQMFLMQFAPFESSDDE
eukprot:TRINITY_DN2324_c1_g3_i2.p1 TRINITY_DN2324_c1_g3~~TRINITY_DN2324_c1_g3_i2.p1  ORF type:complete len:320 (+),score=55.19 TRINITY_DN2324_c1_g3_i2:211-1170(+)